MSDYVFVGSMLNGEALFYSKTKGLNAIEIDHRYLAAVTPKEIEEILRTKPHLKSFIYQANQAKEEI